MKYENWLGYSVRNTIFVKFNPQIDLKKKIVTIPTERLSESLLLISTNTPRSQVEKPNSTSVLGSLDHQGPDGAKLAVLKDSSDIFKKQDDFREGEDI